MDGCVHLCIIMKVTTKYCYSHTTQGNLNPDNIFSYPPSYSNTNRKDYNTN